MNGRKLKLNDGKTDTIIVKGNLRSNVVEEFGDFELPCANLCPSVSARNLGIISDSSFNFKNHINSVVKTCNYHIQNLYSIRKFLDQGCLITLVHSLIVSRVDCCNSLYLGLLIIY